MIKLTCIKDSTDSFIVGKDYVLLTRRGGGFVEMLREDGQARDFTLEYGGYASTYYYNILSDYFNLVPANKRMILFEKINNICEFKLKK